MFVLFFAMTAGALILLALEGKPIKPMPFSLASQNQLSTLQSALGTQPGVEPAQWNRIEVTYRTENHFVAGYPEPRGVAVNQFHFLLGNGQIGRDGQVFASSRWGRQQACLRDSRGSYDAQTIRICLICRPGISPAGTPMQIQQLQNLTDSLVRFCRFEPAIVWKN